MPVPAAPQKDTNWLEPAEPEIRMVIGNGARLLAGRSSSSAETVVRSVTATVLVAGVCAVIAWHLGSPALTTSSRAQASGAAFLAAYMEPDGRVVRRDQGGDTVSEGQAYGLLTSVATSNAADFKLIWGWTDQHLSLPDGLLAWHWQDGRVKDPTPAADADVDAAWALDLASNRFGEPRYASDARRMAAAILDEETVVTPLGRVLVAGTWARASVLVEPGYLSPEAFGALGRLTGDRGWIQLASSAERIASHFISEGQLVPDWVSVGASGAISAVTGPETSSTHPSYGLDAGRFAAWASVCSAPFRQAAASEWTVLRPSAEDRRFSISLGQDGKPESGYSNAAMAISDSAAADARGDTGDARALLDSAKALNKRYSTYYGSAWIALWQLLVTSPLLHSC